MNVGGVCYARADPAAPRGARDPAGVAGVACTARGGAAGEGG